MGDDAIAEVYASVSLVEQDWVDQIDVARAFGRPERSVRCDQRRCEAGGLAALGRPGGYPAVGGAPIARAGSFAGRLHAEVRNLRHIAECVGASEKAICK